MPEWMKWFFDGLGTEIVGSIISIATIGIVGYGIGKRRKRIIQNQEAGSGSKQYQKGSSVPTSYNDEKNQQYSKTSFRQRQKAGDNSIQTQIGDQDNG